MVPIHENIPCDHDNGNRVTKAQRKFIDLIIHFTFYIDLVLMPFKSLPNCCNGLPILFIWKTRRTPTQAESLLQRIQRFKLHHHQLTCCQQHGSNGRRSSTPCLFSPLTRVTTLATATDPAATAEALRGEARSGGVCYATSYALSGGRG